MVCWKHVKDDAVGLMRALLDTAGASSILALIGYVLMENGIYAGANIPSDPGIVSYVVNGFFIVGWVTVIGMFAYMFIGIPIKIMIEERYLGECDHDE